MRWKTFALLASLTAIMASPAGAVTMSDINASDLTGCGVGCFQIGDKQFTGLTSTFDPTQINVFGSQVGDTVFLNFGGPFASTNGPAVDIDVYPEVASTGQVAYTFGLGQRFADDTALIGGVFEKKSTDTNWFAVCGDGTTLSTRVDTGVAVGAAAWNKLRVEWHGANVADNSTAAMRFYIADVLVATITSNLPTGAATPSVNAVLGAKRASGSTVTSCYLGPVRFSQNY
jgi:hypothetical protein